MIVRPRPESATVGDWAAVLRELPLRVSDWVERLQGEGIRGADLVFACIGPALEIFSRYRKVERPDGTEVSLAEYLEKVWEVVGRTALEQVLGAAEANADGAVAGTLEEDARLTALFLWTVQSTVETNGGNGAKNGDSDGDDDERSGSKKKHKGLSLIFDVVRRFAQPLGIHLDAWEGRVIATEKGVVRLLPVAERAKQLFGTGGVSAMAEVIENASDGTPQLRFTFMDKEPKKKRRRRKTKKGKPVEIDEGLSERPEATTLDRLHAALLFQKAGRAGALRRLLKAERDKGPGFERLANALSALYPRSCEEKRLLDAMLVAMPR